MSRFRDQAISKHFQKTFRYQKGFVSWKHGENGTGFAFLGLNTQNCNQAITYFCIAVLEGESPYSKIAF